MHNPIPGLSGHSVFLLLVQLALLVAVARIGAEISKRLGLPAVVGELSAGIALGPTLLGHYFPQVFTVIFPADKDQFHLLDAFGRVDTSPAERAWTEVTRIEAELREAREDLATAERDREYLEHACEEIERLAPQEGE